MHGTIYEEHAGRLTRIVDRTGTAWAQLEWDDDRLTRLAVPGAFVLGVHVVDPLLGDAHPVIPEGSAGAGTAMSALDWPRPAEIPTIAAPGKLPAGAGGALLNAIAVLAARAGVPALRYAGPYPTPALWRSLVRSFRTTATEAEFTRDLFGRAARIARDPIAIDFVPAPCERVEVTRTTGGIRDFGCGYVELRDGLERAVLDGIAYERDGSPARLVEDRAEIWFGDARWAHVATFAPDGSLAENPHPIPAVTSEVVGQEFPPALAGALAELIAELVPAPLAADARRWVASRPIRWADLGGRAARAEPDGLAVHAALWERIGPLGLGRLALALAEALAPVVTGAILAEVMSG